MKSLPIHLKLEKEHKIQNLFSSISHTYDLTNSILSLRLDRSWRDTAVEISAFKANNHILDCCAGTGEMAIRLAQKLKCHVTIVDFSMPMLQIAKEKAAKEGCASLISCVDGNIKQMPFQDNTFHGAVLAFSLRNLPFLKETLLEIKRVLLPNGKIIFLELTKPQNFIIRQFYFFYLKKILPFMGGVISGKLSAYKYLAESILDFYEPQVFLNILQEAGFTGVKLYPLTLGIASIFMASKP